MFKWVGELWAKIPQKTRNAVVRFTLQAVIVGISAMLTWMINDVQSLPFPPAQLVIIASALSMLQKYWKDSTGRP